MVIINQIGFISLIWTEISSDLTIEILNWLSPWRSTMKNSWGPISKSMLDPKKRIETVGNHIRMLSFSYSVSCWQIVQVFVLQIFGDMTKGDQGS